MDIRERPWLELMVELGSGVQMGKLKLGLGIRLWRRLDYGEAFCKSRVRNILLCL
jgi:hypothetical protein